MNNTNKDYKSALNQILMVRLMSLVFVVLIVFFTILFGGCTSSRSKSKTTTSDTTTQVIKDFIPVNDLAPLGLKIGDSLNVKRGDIDFTMVKVSEKFYAVASKNKVIRHKETTTTFIPTSTKLKVNAKINSDNKTKVDSHDKDKSKVKIDSHDKDKGKVKTTTTTKTKEKGLALSWWLWLVLIALVFYTVYRVYKKIWPGGVVWKGLSFLTGRK